MKNEWVYFGDAVFILITDGRGWHGLTRIDEEDIEKVCKYGGTWQANSINASGKRYVVGRGSVETWGEGYGSPTLHRWIMDEEIPDGCLVDHINHNTLDNRRSNLRAVSHKENTQNRVPHKNNASGFRGVSLHRASGLWRAVVVADGKQHSLGYHRTPEEAAKVARKGRAQLQSGSLEAMGLCSDNLV